MMRWFENHLRWLSLILAGLLCTTLFILGFPSHSALAAGNGINVIIMIGDGMGWNMARATSTYNAVFKEGKKDFPYTSGKGNGLSFQNLSGYSFATTYGTTIPGSDGVFNTSNSALDNSNPVTGKSNLLPGFKFSPSFNPGSTPSGGENTNQGAVGNLVGYDPKRGGPNPWTPITAQQAADLGFDKEYIKLSYPDSANTATTLYTGVKSYNNAIGVDIFEQDLTTIQEIATQHGKSTGIVTSVPISHATPGAAISTVNRRNKYDSDFPALDSILQEAIVSDEDGTTFLPTVLLGGGHPLDYANSGEYGGTFTFEYITEATYKELSSKPTSNLYGYTFLERAPNAAQTLLSTAQTLDPNNGSRLLGLYGARGQNGNLPTSAAKGDYSTTGLDNFSLYSSANASNNPTPGIPHPDTIRPLMPGETDAEFIATEINENPTLKDMTNAALEVLSKDKDGFWLMVEGGDIDWAAHDNNLDNLIGTVKDFDKAVQAVIDWIGKNGGWSKNLLIVTADHDHYLNLNNDFPQLLSQNGAEALTYQIHDPNQAGHYWGSDPTYKYQWGNHSNRPVPVYFQGDPSTLVKYIGQGFTSYGFSIPSVPGAVDQTHIFLAMEYAITHRGR